MLSKIVALDCLSDAARLRRTIKLPTIWRLAVLIPAVNQVAIKSVDWLVLQPAAGLRWSSSSEVLAIPNAMHVGIAVR